jgi:hypothetical protein
MQPRKPGNITELLARIAQSAAGVERVSLGVILEQVGRTSFSPLLLLAGLITMAPVIGDIPGVPTLMAVLVALTAGQLLLGRDYVWLPQWLLRRNISQAKLCTAVDWLRRPARFIDRLLRPRLSPFTHGAGAYAIAVACLLIAAALPVAEFIPFSANGLGIALTVFALALLAGDGLMAVIAFSVTGVTIAIALLAVIA